MSEFSSTKDLSTLLLSDFMLFSSFILSHPLYSSYFIFFSPYLFKIFSFLSPLFLTTSLFLLAFLDHDLPESKVTFSFLLTAYQTLVQTLRSSKFECHYESDHDGIGYYCLEMLEAFKILLETSTTVVEFSEKYPDEVSAVEGEEEASSIDKGLSLENKSRLDEKPAGKKNQVKAVVKLFENFLQEKDGVVENLSSKKRDNKDAKSLCVESNKGKDEQKDDGLMMMMIGRRGSKAKLGINKATDDPPNVLVSAAAKNGLEHPAAAAAAASPTVQRADDDHWRDKNGDDHNSETMGSNLGNFGSIRNQKEWKRTLACKLFEERHSDNVDRGDEGMDLLWETYETESVNKVRSKIGSKKGKKGAVVDYNGNFYDNYDEDDYDDETHPQLCCLQALKFSAGKMNLGMGRPNLVKFSKALKGFGWLHHVSSRRAKKGYH